MRVDSQIFYFPSRDERAGSSMHRSSQPRADRGWLGRLALIVQLRTLLRWRDRRSRLNEPFELGHRIRPHLAPTINRYSTEGFVGQDNFKITHGLFGPTTQNCYQHVIYPKLIFIFIFKII